MFHLATFPVAITTIESIFSYGSEKKKIVEHTSMFITRPRTLVISLYWQNVKINWEKRMKIDEKRNLFGSSAIMHSDQFTCRQYSRRKVMQFYANIEHPRRWDPYCTRQTLHLSKVFSDLHSHSNCMYRNSFLCGITFATQSGCGDEKIGKNMHDTYTQIQSLLRQFRVESKSYLKLRCQYCGGSFFLAPFDLFALFVFFFPLPLQMVFVASKKW